jgi:hypothetical protein
MNRDERSKKFDRRQTLKVFGLTVGGALVFQGCKEEVKPPPPAPAPAPAAPAAVAAVKPEPAAAPPPAEPAAPAPAEAAQPVAAADGDLNCKEKAPIDDASKSLRRALQYKEKSAEAGKNCGGCAQFEAAKYGACGSCKLFTGAVNPGGHCLSYAPKA